MNDTNIDANSNVVIDDHGRPEPPLAAGEAYTIVGFLDYQRATLAWRCSGQAAIAETGGSWAPWTIDRTIEQRHATFGEVGAGCAHIADLDREHEPRSPSAQPSCTVRTLVGLATLGPAAPKDCWLACCVETVDRELTISLNVGWTHCT